MSPLRHFLIGSMFVLCFDCGATNVRAILIDEKGHLISKASSPNSTLPSSENPDFHIWDVDRILQQLADCARKILADINPRDVRAITITTFGVDGALVDASGRLLYPVISWKCPRTAEIMHRVGQYISQEKLNQISGIGPFAFNTIYKIIWLKENRPELFDKAQSWLFISNLLAWRLTGEMTTDRTMAGTSQMTDLHTGEFSEEILSAIGLTPALFPRMVNAGDLIGSVTQEAADRLNLPLAGVPVLSSGHDTQFAVFGSGAQKNQPVLSSGTWEILMVRSALANLSAEDFQDGATAELDADPQLRNPGLQWISSGIIEWIKSTCFRGESFDTMDAEAAAIPPGCHGVSIVPDFLPSDPIGGSISGLTIGRTRAHIYRAAMEALSYRLRSRLQRLEIVGGFKSQALVLVGGGARNKVWTQMRADILNLPVLVSQVSESTVLGASMFALAGIGAYSSPEEARQIFGISYETCLPGSQSAIYQELLAKQLA